MKEKKNEKASRQKNGGGGSETSRTLLGETKQHASDNGQGCENSGNEEMLRETPGKITQKQYFCCLHKRHRGEWEGFWQSPCAIRRHKPERSPTSVRDVRKALARADLGVHSQETLQVGDECKNSFHPGHALSCPT